MASSRNRTPDTRLCAITFLVIFGKLRPEHITPARAFSVISFLSRRQVESVMTIPSLFPYISFINIWQNPVSSMNMPSALDSLIRFLTIIVSPEFMPPKAILALKFV